MVQYRRDVRASSLEQGMRFPIKAVWKKINNISSVFEGRHIDHPSSKVDTSIIDRRKLTHRSSIFESRHIDLRRSKAKTSHRQPNITPIFRQFVTEYCPQWRSIVIPKIPRGIRITLDEDTHAHTHIYGNSPTCALIMYYMPIYIAYMR